MSIQRIDEMKKFMQIAEGNVAEAKVNPELKQSAELMMKVSDGLDSEYEEIMGGADPDDPAGYEEDMQFAETVGEDAADYKELSRLLINGYGKQAAKMYDGLDTVSREFLWDHLESDEIEFLQKVFGELGSAWLYADEDYDDDDEEMIPAYVQEGPGEEEETCKCGRKGCECGPDCTCEPVEEDLDPDGMGYYNVTVQHEDNYPDEVETAVPYDEAVRAAQSLVDRLKRGQWEVRKYKMQDAVEWQMLTGDEESVTVRVEPTDDADAEAWHGIGLESIAESVLKEDSYADYVDWEDDNPAATGKSDAVRKAAAEKGLDVVDLPLSSEEDEEEEQLGLRFD